MPTDEADAPGVAVPSARLSRLMRLGGLAGGIAGGMLVDGARQVASGKRPTMQDLLMTPANALKVTQQLAQMRGAAMKVGQLLSMDAGDLLPPEMAAILGRLRADADHMPPKQLQTVLNAEWGKGWVSRFAHFNVRPIAAASIGQVHRAQTKDGRDLAIKVQYPGIRASIDSDVNNVANLLRLSGQIPKTVDVASMLDEAKRQLHEEADYTREGACLMRFHGLLGTSPMFQVPRLHDDFSTPNVMAMDYIDSVPVEALTDAPQDNRDRVVTELIDLFLRELFEFRLMQTDPNFANYRYNRSTQQIVLLDFGATRAFAPPIVAKFHQLMLAGLCRDRPRIRAAALDIGYFDERTLAKHQDAVLDMMELAMEPLQCEAGFDFGRSDLAARLRDMGLQIGAERDFWHIPPMDALFLQRKVAGVFLLASKLKARVELGPLVQKYQ
jgi:predicted unusual protein kinase regulating ubiquinone biosynthesis (AarF/ABC1/UbiB family)